MAKGAAAMEQELFCCNGGCPTEVDLSPECWAQAVVTLLVLYDGLKVLEPEQAAA